MSAGGDATGLDVRVLSNELRTQTNLILKKLDVCEDSSELESIRLAIVGKNGLISQFFRHVKALASKEDKVTLSALINASKKQMLSIFEQRKAIIDQAALDLMIASQRLDVTLPGLQIDAIGSMHPISLTKHRVVDVLSHLGFAQVDGPEIEHVDINFTALNMDEDHPARAMHDTFYCKQSHLLRTHTSNVQIHTMKQYPPPMKVMTLGRVYRSDSDPTHSPMFHQLEAFVVAKHCHFIDLKACVTAFLEAFFDESMPMRFRPSYFPFTEPSAEVDIKGKDGWLEVLGCGMIHPKVLKYSGIDPEIYGGYAFGCGIDRLAMLRYGISDLRQFFINDLSFLRQFKQGD